MKLRFHILILAAFLTILAVSFAEACPTCKESLNEHGGNLIRGYFLSIMFMMSMPFLILGGLSSIFYLDVRRARRMQAESESAASAGTTS